MSEITADKVAKLLEGITQGDWEYVKGIDDVQSVSPVGNSDPVDSVIYDDGIYPIEKPNMLFIAAAPDIARAYLAKCEEVDQRVISELNGVINQIKIRDKEIEDLQAIIEKQREVLQELRFDFDNSNATNTISALSPYIRSIEEALAITQQQTGGAV